MKLLLILLAFVHAANALGPLIFSEEFNYNGPPDPNIWNTQIGGGGWGMYTCTHKHLTLNRIKLFYTNLKRQ